MDKLPPAWAFHLKSNSPECGPEPSLPMDKGICPFPGTGLRHTLKWKSYHISDMLPTPTPTHESPATFQSEAVLGEKVFLLHDWTFPWPLPLQSTGKCYIKLVVAI